jgi:hypothetical protein
LSSPPIFPQYVTILTFQPHTHPLLTSLQCQSYIPQAPATHDTSTLHYNSRNTPNVYKGHKSPYTSSPTPPFTLTPLVPPLPINQISIFSQITITPIPTIYRYYH